MKIRDVRKSLIDRKGFAGNVESVEAMNEFKQELQSDFVLELIGNNKTASILIANNVVTDTASVTPLHRLATENIKNSSTYSSLMNKSAHQLKSLTGANITKNLQNDIYAKYGSQQIPAYDGQGNIKFIDVIKGSGYDVDHTITVASILPGGENYEFFIDVVRHCNGNALEALKLICRGEYNLNLLKAYDNRVLKNSNTGSKVKEFSEEGRRLQKGLEDTAKQKYTEDTNKNVNRSIAENAIITLGIVVMQQALTFVLREVADSIMDFIGRVMIEERCGYDAAISKISTSKKIKNAFENKLQKIKHMISLETIKEAFTWENIKTLFKTVLIQGAAIIVSSISTTFRAAVTSVDAFKNLFRAAQSSYKYYTTNSYDEKHEASKDAKSYIISALSVAIKAISSMLNEIVSFIMLILAPLITMITALLIFVVRMHIDIEDKLKVKQSQFNIYMDENF